MTNNETCIVIGAGQAGLAMSHCLRLGGVPHIMFERGGVAERWRSERWDSFTLLSSNWQTRLPGHHYRGADPDGFLTGAEVVALLEHHARLAPVRCGVTVHAVQPHDGGWRVRTTCGDYWAEDVVVATGGLDRPRIPGVAAQFPASVTQLHTSRYRNPKQLPDGGVLVVGAGPSGQQIADELAQAGRRVHIAVGRHRTLPRRYRGHDAYWWMDRMGTLDRTIDTLADPETERRSPNAVLAGGDADLDVHGLVARGVVPHGHLLSCTDGVTRFGGDLMTILAEAEDNATRFRRRVDEYVARTGMDACPGSARRRPLAWAQHAAREIDLATSGITSVVWATGFALDLSWIHAPVFDLAGHPVHDRGITPAPGLHFLGLKWQHRRSSNFLDGVGPDAEYVAERIVSRRAVDARVAA